MSAAQGTYTTAQLMLDITQGSRVSTSAYSPQRPPALSLRPRYARRGGRGVAGGARSARTTRRRSSNRGCSPRGFPAAPATRASPGRTNQDGVAAADQGGRIAALSLGSAATLPARIAALNAREQLVVADLPAGAPGLSDLRVLSAARPAGELEIVVQRAPDAPGNELLWVAVGGLGGGHTITSQSTNQRGLISAVDLAPTILRHLGLAIPDEMRGKPIELDGSFDGAYLRSFKGRLQRHLRSPTGSAGLSLRRLGTADARRACAATLQSPCMGGARGGPGAAVDAGGGARPGGVRARSRGRRRAARADLLRPRRDQRPAAALAARAARASGRRGRGADRRRARRHAAARALAARPQPGARRALLRDRQRAQVGARRARASPPSPPRCTPRCGAAGRPRRWPSAGSCSR